MYDILFTNADVITMDKARPLIFNGFVGITGKSISYLSEERPDEGAKRTISGQNRILMPGLVNAHGHTPMTLLRGYADDHTLQDWLNNYIFPAEARLTASEIKTGAKLGYMESLAAGITSITDMYKSLPAMYEAAVETGVRSNMCHDITAFSEADHDFYNHPAIQETMYLLEHQTDTAGRVRIDAGIHAPYTSEPRDWKNLAGFAREKGLNIQLHLSETKQEREECLKTYGKSPAVLFYEAGVLRSPVTAAHCVWVDENDMDLLKSCNVSVAHNPISNLKLASGIAPVRRMLQKGINVALGSDGASSNNSLDLFEEMKLAAILQKGVSHDPTAVCASEALKMATLNGAAAQGRSGEIGMVKVGYEADLILLRTDLPHMQPIYHPVSATVYCGRGADVALTMVQGRILYQNGEFQTIDQEKVYWEAKEFAKKIKMC